MPDLCPTRHNVGHFGVETLGTDGFREQSVWDLDRVWINSVRTGCNDVLLLELTYLGLDGLLDNMLGEEAAVRVGEKFFPKSARLGLVWVIQLILNQTLSAET